MTAFKALDEVWVVGSEATGLIEWGFECPPMIAGDGHIEMRSALFVVVC